MVSKKDWLKKIGKWFIDQSNNNDEDINFESNNYGNIQETERKLIDDNSQKEIPKSIEIPIDRAFKLFCWAWEEEGHKTDCYLSGEDFKKAIGSLDDTFKSEISEWLIKCSNKPSLINNLEKIVSSGEVNGQDDFETIQAFSFLSFLIKKENIAIKPQIIKDKPEIEIEKKNENLKNLNVSNAESSRPDNFYFQTNEFKLEKSFTEFDESAFLEVLNGNNKKKSNEEISKSTYSDADNLNNDELKKSHSKNTINSSNIYTNIDLDTKDKLEDINTNPIYSKPIHELENVSLKTINSLRRNHYEKLSDLIGIKKSKLLLGKNFGSSSYADLKLGLQKIKVDIDFILELNKDSFGKINNISNISGKDLKKEFWQEVTNKFANSNINIENLDSKLNDFFNINIRDYEIILQKQFFNLLKKIEFYIYEKNKDSGIEIKYLKLTIFKFLISHFNYEDASIWLSRFYRNLTRQMGINIIIIAKILFNEDKSAIANELGISYNFLQNKEKSFLESLKVKGEDFYNELSIIKSNRDVFLNNKEPHKFKFGTKLLNTELENWNNIKNQYSKKKLNIENIDKNLEEFFLLSTNETSRTLKSLFYKISDSLDEFGVEYKNEYKYLKLEIFKLFISEFEEEEGQKLIRKIFKTIIRDNGKSVFVILERLKGKTLQEISNNFNLSRERVRQIESKMFKSMEVDLARKFYEDYLTEIESINLREEEKIIKSLISEFGKLPIKEDQIPTNFNYKKLWDSIIQYNFYERIETYKKFKIDIPKKEYDYHYLLLNKKNELADVGNGYWKEIKNLKEYLYRHAEFLGEPKLMPKQTSTPYRIKGVVQRFGGQSVVANKIGLKYQGQLVNTDGSRIYWTDKRLLKLLDDVNIFSSQKIEIMPSYSQIIDFFRNTEIEEYKNKKPNSAVAALTKMGNLAWLEVAQRFNKHHFSGISQKVTVQFIKAFVRDLGEHLAVLSPSELYVLFQAQGINRKEQEKFSRTFDVLIDAVQTGVVNKKDLEDWSNNLEVPSIKELLNLGGEVKHKYSKEEKELRLLKRKANILKREYQDSKPIKLNEITVDDLPNLDPGKTLKALDKAAGVIESSGTDASKIEFLKAKASSKLWDSCFANEELLIKKLEANISEKDTYSDEVRTKFLSEYYGAKKLSIPHSYQFKDLKGRNREPKLMQRLVSYRLLKDKRILNLSGTGTGKTLSAIFASQICKCQRIFISCPNGVIDSWIRTFKTGYPEAVLHIKPENWIIEPLQNKINVVIVNHERFQNRFSDNLLQFCSNFSPDMIVIDEIHQSKKRKETESSQRRSLINQFIRISLNLNPEIRVLGLSATPVINNIYEGRSLVELVTQETLFDVKANDELNSCMNLYQHFIINGIRMNPGNLSRTEIIPKNVDASSLLPEIIAFTRRGLYHEVERLLVKPKLSVLRDCIKRGEKTIIFITLIKGTLIPITNWLIKNNFTYCVYTGNDKDATDDGFNDSLDEFIRGDVEVLVASVQCAGTGVDGLQSVCNKAVFFQLPWTSTEFEQSIGRLDRDGTEYESISVYLPLTNIDLPNGDNWSWCQNKMERIRSKKDIAKAAVDGEIPDADAIFTPSEASKYWLEWLKRLESES